MSSPAMNCNSNSNVAVHRLSPQVSINFRGADVRNGFVSHLKKALIRETINVYIDNDERTGNDLTIFMERMKESWIVITVISSQYADSHWCLNELVKVKESVESHTLKVYPVFYNVEVQAVEEQRGDFGDRFRDLAKKHPERYEEWKKALEFVANRKGPVVGKNSDEGDAVDKIVKEVKEMVDEISNERREIQGASSKKREIPGGRQRKLDGGGEKTELETPQDEESRLFGSRERIEHLKEMLRLQSEEETRVIGLVGMPGIGKTTLAKQVLAECRDRFMQTMFLDVRRKSNCFTSKMLHENLLAGLLKSKNDGKEEVINNHGLLSSSSEELKERVKKSKVLAVLDDVSDKVQIEIILGDRKKWIKDGSKILITTSNKSAIEGNVVDETYLVTGLSDSYALSHFRCHAFPGDASSCDPSFMKLAREFVDYSTGHPLALKLLAHELRNKNKDYWEGKLGALANSPGNTIQGILKIPFDELSKKQKDVFLDIASFFRFESEDYVRSLLDSSAGNVSETRGLADRFLINISGGRVEMTDLLYSFAMTLVDPQTSFENTRGGRRLSDHNKIIDVLKNKLDQEATNVRGIHLDMSKLTKPTPLESDAFAQMNNLRYLKFSNSDCRRGCKRPDSKLNFPDGLEFRLQELRYLHWLKFPLKELPQDFNPKNLIDLNLPHSEIEQVWQGDKDASKLQWVDLNHSSKLQTLSGLSRARHIQSMNLEGCTALETVHEVLQNMERIVFLNLRGCTSLKSLPDMNLVHLKTLILSGCSSFEEFNLIAKSLEKLYLDGTGIKELPTEIGSLQRLILLKLKNCKKLLRLPASIGDLIALQELILSGCSRLVCFPKVRQNLKHLKTLLLDGTGITEIEDGQTSSMSLCNSCELPRGIYGLSSVLRLSLSRNDFKRLPHSLGYLYHLKWLDVKHCKKLVSIPMLPPNLQCLDAHGCISLQHIFISPDHLLAATEHLHSTFVFTNCTKLDHVVMNTIVSYAQKKIMLMSNALADYEEGFALDVLIGICFPAWHIPLWFNHRSVGSELKHNLPPHWNDAGPTGIALCAVVSFEGHLVENTRLLVTCRGEFKNKKEEEEEQGPKKEESVIQFSCILGGWTGHGSHEPRVIKSGHLFIGYTSWLHVKKRDNSGGCVRTEASLKFQVTDGTKEIQNFKVVKCGFSLIYAASNAHQSLSTETCSDVTIPPTSLRSWFWQKLRGMWEAFFYCLLRNKG